MIKMIKRRASLAVRTIFMAGEYEKIRIDADDNDSSRFCLMQLSVSQGIMTLQTGLNGESDRHS